MIPSMAPWARYFPSRLYAILRMNFPLMSKEYSFFLLSTPKMFTCGQILGIRRKGQSPVIHRSCNYRLDLFTIFQVPEMNVSIKRTGCSNRQAVTDVLPDPTAGPAFHHIIFRPSPGCPGSLWPLSQSFLSCLSSRPLTKQHHHGLALV